MFNKLALNPLIMPVMFADPKGAVKNAKGTKMKLKNTGNIGVPGVKSASSRARNLLVKEAMEKEAILGWIKKAPGRVGGFAKKHPILSGAGLILAGAGGLALGDSLADKARTVGRARGYREMMNNYGDEINHLAEFDGQGRVPQERIRQAYNALHTVAPDIARDPTLAAAQMSPLIRMMADSGTRMDPEGTRGLAMLESLDQFVGPSNLQGKIPKRKNFSDYVATSAGGTTALGKAQAMLADPRDVEMQKQLGRQAAQRDPNHLEQEEINAHQRAYFSSGGKYESDKEHEQDLLNRARNMAYEQQVGRDLAGTP